MLKFVPFEWGFHMMYTMEREIHVRIQFPFLMTLNHSLGNFQKHFLRNLAYTSYKDEPLYSNCSSLAQGNQQILPHVTCVK